MKNGTDWNSIFVIAWTIVIFVCGVLAIADVAVNAPTPSTNGGV